MAAVVLAAGGSTRMGPDPKLLLPYGGEPLVRWPVRAAIEAGLGDIGVVLGADADRVAGALSDLGVHRIDNPDHGRGMSTSVARGVAWAHGRGAAALLLLGDEPDVSPAAIRRVLEEWRRHPDGACRARYADRIGHPVIVGHGTAGLPAGDAGLLRGGGLRGRDVREVRIDAPAPADIDTPEDYREALARLPH